MARARMLARSPGGRGSMFLAMALRQGEVEELNRLCLEAAGFQVIEKSDIPKRDNSQVSF